MAFQNEVGRIHKSDLVFALVVWRHKFEVLRNFVRVNAEIVAAHHRIRIVWTGERNAFLCDRIEETERIELAKLMRIIRIVEANGQSIAEHENLVTLRIVASAHDAL